jgi:pyocin large subunit-like protein
MNKTPIFCRVATIILAPTQSSSYQHQNKTPVFPAEQDRQDDGCHDFAARVC